MGMRDSAATRCRAPKTAKGAAKHKLLKATILSRPRACARFVFAAHSAIRKSRMPAAHIETGVREISKNAARRVVCICAKYTGVRNGTLPKVSQRAVLSATGPRPNLISGPVV